MYSRVEMRMKFRNLISFVISVLFVLGLATACHKEFSPVEKGEGNVTLSFSPAEMDVLDLTTKSVDDDVDEGLAADYEVKDFWLFEYDENGALLGAPRYYLTEDYQAGQDFPVSVILPSSSELRYKIVIIANTHDASLLSSISFNTLEALKASSLAVSSSSDLYGQDESSYDLMMNGVSEISSTTSNVNCMLYRNVAKLELTITNRESSGITINSVQLRNVPDRLSFADQLHKEDIYSPNPSSVHFRSLEKDMVNIAEGGSASLTYYLPRNTRGTNDSTTESGKNVNAPDHATYLELIAVRTATRTAVAYRFYLGADDIGDFNVEPNHLYKVNLDFTIFGDENDNRVEDMSVVLLEDSNSYIINPVENLVVKYSVPIENRINTFWKSEAGKLKDDWRRYCLNGSDSWVAEVIWQDVSGKQLIQFCNEDGTLADTYRGLRDDKFFSFVTTDAAVGVPANIVIGVRRTEEDGWTAEDGYMWSWHLWLTDYDPYEDVGGWVDGKYSYDVPGGSLHRYSSFEDFPIYQGKFIMDRNLGARGHTRDDGWLLCAGMMYQYGRKDPFPASNQNQFKIDGTAGPSVGKSTASVGIYRSVMSPMTFLNTKDINWTSDNVYASYNWNDLNKEAVRGEGKSFFDPCPPGWKLPVYDIWTMFGNKNEAYASNWVSTDVNENTFATNSTNAGWMLYLRGVEKTGDTAYFPAAGKIDRTSGGYSGGVSGSLWSTSNVNANNARYLYYENRPEYFLLPAQNFYRSMGLPVRCIRE